MRKRLVPGEIQRLIKRHHLFRWLVLAAVLFGLAYLLRFCVLGLSDSKQTTTITTVESPDHVWKAVVTETYIETVFAPVNDIGDDVCLGPVSGSAPCVEILSVGTSGQSDDHPTVTWMSDHDLRIKLTYGQDPTHYLHDISGVHVEVYHDVAAEAAFKAEIDRNDAIRQKFSREHPR